ncbi:MAG: HigA family addiction module antitoxin [Cyanobacteria bacterium J06555_13]
MSNLAVNEFIPDYVSSPGETLLEALEERGMSQAELAERTGRHKKTINEIIKGKAALTPETALQLEHVLGIPARFWNNREQQYRETLAKLQEHTHLESQVDWLKTFPVTKMVQLGWIPKCDNKVEQLESLLNFFGIASAEQWQSFWESRLTVAFRKSESHVSEPGDLTGWLRQGEIEAEKIPCAPYQQKKFKEALNQVRLLTVESPEIFQPQVVELCASAGVAVVFVPQLPKTRASGATHWVHKDKALIQLSLRYKMDDHLWFSFFHEAAHILLHQKREMFLEFSGKQEKSSLEIEADLFAADFLIPPAQLEKFLSHHGFKLSKVAIQQFASNLGIAPGIVVGRLQHEGRLPMKNCNGLKRRLEWAID